MMTPRSTPEFAARLRRARQTAGLTQKALADRAGLHDTYVGVLERGGADPTLYVIVTLATALGMDPGELVSGIEP